MCEKWVRVVLIAFGMSGAYALLRLLFLALFTATISGGFSRSAFDALWYSSFIASWNYLVIFASAFCVVLWLKLDFVRGLMVSLGGAVGFACAVIVLCWVARWQNYNMILVFSLYREWAILLSLVMFAVFFKWAASQCTQVKPPRA